MFKPVILSLGSNYKVRNTSGEDLGKIEEVVVDESEGCIHYAVLSPGGLFQGGSPLVAVPWRRLEMQNDQKHFLLNVDKETLKNANHFPRDAWPDMTMPEWREQVETYFAYNPADENHAAEGSEFIDDGTNSISIDENNLDGQIAYRVEFELFATKAFDMKALHVTARGGEVTLSGRVESRAESILAANTARSVEGVTGVMNKLTVSKVA